MFLKLQEPAIDAFYPSAGETLIQILHVSYMVIFI